MQNQPLREGQRAGVDDLVVRGSRVRDDAISSFFGEAETTDLELQLRDIPEVATDLDVVSDS